MVSAVLITCNEKHELERCLSSIKSFVDEIVIVDLNSTDGSQEVFEKYDAKVFQHSRVPYADPIRNWALEKARGDWILMLDPDEEIPETLIQNLTGFLKSDKAGEITAVNIPFKNIFWGHWIAHTNFWPDKHIRFFRRGRVAWQDTVHSYPKVEGKVLELTALEENAINHFGYLSRSEFFRKQLNYARIEARNRHTAGEGFSPVRLFWLPLKEFLARFIKHRGYLDGADGLFLVVSLMCYRIMVEINLLKGSYKTSEAKS